MTPDLLQWKVQSDSESSSERDVNSESDSESEGNHDLYSDYSDYSSENHEPLLELYSE